MLITGYSDFSLEAPGCSPGEVLYRANFTLDADITHLYPYINAVVEGSQYHDVPHHIQFIFKGHRCALYPDKAVAALFENDEQASMFIKLLIDFLNDLHARKDSLEPNHKNFKPLPVLEIYRLLPRINCQECGFSSCMAFANALSSGETDFAKCPDLTDSENKNAMALQSMLAEA